MRGILFTVALIGVLAIGGCTGGVLDPKGPIITFAERQILFDATGIMLAIVIPVMLATLGVAFWFRASNERARTYRVHFFGLPKQGIRDCALDARAGFALPAGDKTIELESWLPDSYYHWRGLRIINCERASR
jgi:hypothetical protein